MTKFSSRFVSQVHNEFSKKNLPYLRDMDVTTPGGVFLLPKKQPSPKELAKVQAKEMDLANEPGHKSLIILLLVLLLMEENLTSHLGCILQQDFSHRLFFQLSMICPDAPFQPHKSGKPKHTGRVFTRLGLFSGQKLGNVPFWGLFHRYGMLFCFSLRLIYLWILHGLVPSHCYPI